VLAGAVSVDFGLAAFGLAAFGLADFGLGRFAVLPAIAIVLPL
jgi:hypothetical protein